MSTNKIPLSIIPTITWTQWEKTVPNLFIRKDDYRYHILKEQLINTIFPRLHATDKNLLVESLVRILNFIHMKTNVPATMFWTQLTQNHLLDLHAIVNLMLPFINEDEDQAADTNKHQLQRLADLYIATDATGKFIYTASQYNRCVRQGVRVGNNETTTYKFRPFLPEYFLDHLALLLMSIESASNKLYVNWLDVLPVPMNAYQATALYQHTVNKLHTAPVLLDTHLDPKPGLSYQDIYNVLSNHLFHEIVKERWLIYSMVIGGKSTNYINLLDDIFTLQPVWDGTNWSMLTDYDRARFHVEWRDFINSNSTIQTTILHHFYFYFSKYHRNAQKLIGQGKLILSSRPTDEDENEEYLVITPDLTQDAKRGLALVPAEEIYLFFFDHITAFKKTWFYYLIKIRGQNFLVDDGTYVVTPKTIYNYAKSLIHKFDYNAKVPFPNHWQSLPPYLLEIVLIRLTDTPHRYYNDWTIFNWFNINSYFRRVNPDIAQKELPALNKRIHDLIRSQLPDIIFQSLIYHGLLSTFQFNPQITDTDIVSRYIRSNNTMDIVREKKLRIKQYVFNPLARKTYQDSAYYYLTGASYGELEPEPGESGDAYFDYVVTDAEWMLFYAMNWVSQLNFYHHYAHNRVIYVTGAPGVGKSTQIPKLLLYGLRMIDYHHQGKIICTQPRIQPTFDNTVEISRQMGVPIRLADQPSNNFYIQFQHSQQEHVDKRVDSFLRMVTDGTLLDQMKNSAFLTKSVPDDKALDIAGQSLEWVKTYTANNIYDIVIVDEAHEHGPNMDMILTLMNHIIYVNNSIKLIIVSATMEDDEPIYRRYYRNINDNRMYPPNMYINVQNLDRANVDRRIHISPPGGSTQYPITDHWPTQSQSDELTDKTFVELGIKKTIEVASKTIDGGILLFLSGRADIDKAVTAINTATSANIICLGFYGELTDEQREKIKKFHDDPRTCTLSKIKPEIDVEGIVPLGTYTRVVLIATNVAEASITLNQLKYVVDTGYAKVNTFDPLEGINKLVILPISWASVRQRRGRVGRRQPGEVYYLYSKDRMINNRTVYKITDIDIMPMLVDLLKWEMIDTAIVNESNDINAIVNLKNLIAVKGKLILSNYMGNTRAYQKIINKQYLIMSVQTDPAQYYTYYGKTDGKLYADLKNLDLVFERYIRDNHDDYSYQESTTAIFTRCQTGYDAFVLIDQSLSFYLIHPDENVIRRDPFTGKMIGLRYSESVSDTYYHYLLSLHDLTNDNIATYDFSRFHLAKCELALYQAQLLTMVFDVPIEHTEKLYVEYKDMDPVDKNNNVKYYQNMYHHFYIKSEVTIRSELMVKISTLKTILTSKPLRDLNNLIWYTYSMAYHCQSDVLAIIYLIEIVSDLKQWISKIGKQISQENIYQFLNQHHNTEGDLYFVWLIWLAIKELIASHQLLDETIIGPDLQNRFIAAKNTFLIHLEQESVYHRLFDQTKILRNKTSTKPDIMVQLYQRGKLNVEDEFYHYVINYTPDFKTIVTNNKKFMAQLTALSQQHYFDQTVLSAFVVDYLTACYSINQRMWTYQYALTKYLYTDNENEDQKNVIDWVEKHLAFTRMFPITSHIHLDQWHLILETYIRSFSTNLLIVRPSYYLKFNNATRLDPAFWTKKMAVEKTMVNTRQDTFVICHTIQFIKNNFQATYLTPVQLKWVFALNPLYYYYFLFRETAMIYFLHPTKDIAFILRLIMEERKHFALDNLINYIDQVGNPVLAKIVRDDLMQRNDITKN